MTLHHRCIGCDISKTTIDIFDPASGALRMCNDIETCRSFAVALTGSSALVVLEATGAYDRTLCAALAEAGVAHARINPTRARRFAQAAGLMAKTDAVDARMLSQLGQALRPRCEAAPDPDRKLLSELHKRRDQLVRMRADEKKRAHDANGDLLAGLQRHIDWLCGEIADVQAQIDALIARSDSIRAQAALLRTAPGVGPVTIVTLVALMPELGRLSPKQVASLAGLAPIARDSGAFRGVRRIGQGRKRVRQALYMAAITARRSCPRYAAFYDRLVAAGKPPKLAIVALARKLLTALNAMIRDNTAFA